MDHVRTPYRWFFQGMLAAVLILIAILLTAAAALEEGCPQAALRLLRTATLLLLAWAGTLAALLWKARRLRLRPSDAGKRSGFSFLTDLLNEEHDLGYSRQEMALKILEAQAQMDSLQSQINPHFLYNTLESIRSKALLHDEEEIATMTETLARLFRYNINRNGTKASILDELENVKNYIRIQNYRFRDKFTLRLELDGLEELTGSYMLPVLTLQPIVENAIHHGLEPKIGPGSILIRGFCTQSKLILQIRDDGVGIPPRRLDELRARLLHPDSGELIAPEGDGTSRRGSGIALKNVHQRLQLFFGPAYGLEITSAPGAGTQIEFCMPAPSASGDGEHEKRAV